MITIILQGGLGNQMFQYAAAKALSTRLNTDVKVDISLYKIHQNKSWCRPYELDIFNINAKLDYSTNYIKKTKLSALSQYGKTAAVRTMKKISHIYDSSTQPVAQWHQCKDNTTLWGYFASEVYFRENRPEILKDFQFKKELDERNQEVTKNILATHSVSVHIRRGDYLNAVNSKVFAALSPQWYHEAIQTIKEKVTDAHFYFFSDDMEWTRQTFHEIENATFIDWNHGADSYKDMQLMSLCEHNIIPNSTFSWWGAWLNTHPDKIVIAPSIYYLDDKENENYRANMPQEWILL